MNLTDPIFSDETKAREYFEAIRWPNGPYCVHCGEAQKVYRLSGKSTRPGLFRCNSCEGTFTVTTGGVMESSHIPLTKWAMGFRLYATSKKGFSAHQLHRALGITYKSAWFMAHRIREAMDEANPEPVGGEGKIVEADETYIGTTDFARNNFAKGVKVRSGGADKHKVVALVERGGDVRSFHVHRVFARDMKKLLADNIAPETRLMTDSSRVYKGVGQTFAGHEVVNHSAKEYVRGDAYTNTIEGVFSIFKRGMIGTYQHCGEQHLKRYLAEFDFRYNERLAVGVDDVLRTMKAIKGAEGKRLTYRQPRSPKQAQAGSSSPSSLA